MLPAMSTSCSVLQEPDPFAMKADIYLIKLLSNKLELNKLLTSLLLKIRAVGIKRKKNSVIWVVRESS